MSGRKVIKRKRWWRGNGLPYLSILWFSLLLPREGVYFTVYLVTQAAAVEEVSQAIRQSDGEAKGLG